MRVDVGVRRLVKGHYLVGGPSLGGLLGTLGSLLLMLGSKRVNPDLPLLACLTGQFPRLVQVERVAAAQAHQMLFAARGVPVNPALVDPPPDADAHLQIQAAAVSVHAPLAGLADLLGGETVMMTRHGSILFTFA